VCKSYRQAGSQLFPLHKPLCKSGYWLQTTVPLAMPSSIGGWTGRKHRLRGGRAVLGFGHLPRKHGLSFSCRWVWRWLPFGMWRRVVRQQVFGFSWIRLSEVCRGPSWIIWLCIVKVSEAIGGDLIQRKFVWSTTFLEHRDTERMIILNGCWKLSFVRCKCDWSDYDTRPVASFCICGLGNLGSKTTKFI